MDAQRPPDDLEVWVSPVTEQYQAALRAGADGDLRQARIALLLLLRDEPTHTSAKLRLAVLDDVEANEVSAVTAAHLFKEVLLAVTGRLQESLSEGDAAIGVSPNYAEAYRLRGRTRVEMKDYDGALADYSRAIELSDRNIESLQNRGSLRFRQGDYSGALADYDEAVRRAPSNAEAWLNRGTALGYLGQPERALLDFDRAIELDPGCPQPYINKSELYARAGWRSQAIEALQELLKHARPSYRSDIQYATQRLKQLQEV